MRLTALATLIVVLTAGGVSGQMDCLEITEAMLESVIRQNIAAGDNPQTPTVDVLDFHPVCLAYSQERDRYRYVSVVVEYTCTGNLDCPSGIAVEQFESQCSSGMWSHIVDGSPDNVRTMSPTANLSTTTREDCTFCFSPGTASGLSLTTDDITHCVACDSSCNEGLMRCYGPGDTQCCQYYNDSTCVDTCPNSRMPDDEYNCNCPSGSTGFNCSQSCPQYCDACDSDPAMCDVCTDSYVLQDNECICAIIRCSRCDTDGNTCDECGAGYKLSNNECVCPVDNCEDCSSDVTKCDRCIPGSIFDTTTSQCVRDCEVANCSKCDQNLTVCEECEDDYKLENNECKCPVDNCKVCDTDPTKCDECSSDYTFDARTSQCIVGNDDGGDDGDGVNIGAIIGGILAGIVFAIIVAAIIIAAIIAARKYYTDKISLKNKELEAQPSTDHLNPLYVKPEEVVDGKPAGGEEVGTGNGEVAAAESNTEGAEVAGEDSS